MLPSVVGTKEEVEAAVGFAPRAVDFADIEVGHTVFAAELRSL